MITWREDFGCWWPDYDAHPEGCYKKVQRRLTDMDFAVARAKDTRVCIQAGGHAGFWPKRLAATFGLVYSFEPEPALYECLRRNTASVPNLPSGQLALGAYIGMVRLEIARSAGSWRIKSDGEAGTIAVQQITIDSLDLASCGAIFLDIEGSEPEALTGATATIAHYRPVLHLETSDKTLPAIEALMKKWGYSQAKRIHGDRVYLPNEWRA